ncbi:hypothetical protein SH501x_003421 [Pirellulaceae bacterium SH501]
MHLESERNDIPMRMEKIREQSRMHATDVALHSERMLDWKEHLRSAPVTTFCLSALAGFAFLYRRPNLSASVAMPMIRNEPGPASVSSSEPSAASSIRTMVLSMATSMLLTTGKQALLRGLQTYLAQSNHGHQSNPRGNPSSPASERLHPTGQASDN